MNGEAVNLKAARIVNDSMARGQTANPDRIRWLASLPWEYPDHALVELERACKAGAVGLMVLAIARMVFDGVLDRYADLEIIASHAGATLPYLAGRMDRSYEMTVPGKKTISAPPSAYLRRIHYAAVTYQREAIELCIAVGGAEVKTGTQS